MRKELREAVDRVAFRFRYLRSLQAMILSALVVACACLGLYILGSPVGAPVIPNGWPLFGAMLLFYTAVGLPIIFFVPARDRRWVIRRIEARYPDLETRLLAAVEVDEAAGSRNLGFLQATVIREAVEHSRQHKWEAAVSDRTVNLLQLAFAMAMTLWGLAGGALNGLNRSQAEERAAIAAVSDSYDVRVDPGNTQIERGTTLLVIARFNGAVPPDVRLVIDAATPRAMTRSLEDPMFAGRVEAVNTDLAYHVEFAGRSTETYHARVFEYPALERADAKLVFPSYTDLKPKTAEDVRHVTAVEGTDLTLLCRLNKDVATARLVTEDGEAVTLTPEIGSEHVYKAQFKLIDPRRYHVQLIDSEGRTNKLPAEIALNVTRNRPPVVKMSRPTNDVRVSPIEELALKAELDDDFGLVRHGITYTPAGQEPREILLSAASPKIKHASAEHLLDFESLHAAPDQLITYFFWAEDVGPDGQPRRASGDLFFAEVRPFEEIFRQGEQPSASSAENEEQEQQDGGNAQQSDKLAELQKEIINATWKLVRRETGAKPSDKFAEDVKLLQESQHSAIEQAAPLAERLTDAKSKASLEQAASLMKDAEKHLGTATVKSLAPALVAEQSAYQALLKLRAREFEVIRNNSRQRQQNSRNSARSPSQRQLQQLELSNEENRYEDQRSARAQQEKLSQREREQGEDRQVANRLKELARRQTDLNDRVKELQSALEAAKDQKAREEIERQLKRLRDQQQQILRDTDELQERMEREENRERMAEARQQVEQGREHVRQASEALEQGRLPQAVTEGARAGRQLNEVREEMRKGASNGFTEEMTEMRDQARHLDEDQKKLTDQLEAWNQRPQGSLRDKGEREQTRKGLEQQRERLDQILERMRKTVQDAEETEPLLAKQLFDTARKATEQQTPDALKVAEQLARAGIAEDAAKSSRRASEGIGQLREGVERAAESVLGDETAALRRAQSELEDLADQVNREIAQASPETRNPQPGNRPGQQEQNPQGQQPGREGQPGQTKGQGDRQGQEAEKGQTKGQGNRQGQEAEKGQPKGQGNQPGQPKGQGNQPGQTKGQGNQPGQEAEPGQTKGQGNQPGQGAGRGGNPPQGGQQPQQGDGSPRDGQEGRQARGGGRQGGVDRLLDGLNNNGPGGPITGEGFRQWSDRMRDVEELLDDPQLRAEAARIRDRARGAREEFKRHAKVPDWNRMKDLVADPLHELRDRVAEEVRRREKPDSLVPIDRDPVPPEFAEGVRRYYERLGAADDDAFADLGSARMAVAGARVAGGRRRRDRLELHARPVVAVGPDRLRVLKGLAFTALALSLLEPLLTGSRPRRGANAFVILADNSQSLLIRDDPTADTRGAWVRDLLAKESAWKTRLGQDFDVRNYVFDSHLRAADGFETLTFDGNGTALTTSLSALAKRFRGLPLAGVLLVTDGNRTDTGAVDWSRLPPVYPVIPPARGVVRDIGVQNVSVSQTNFEAAPVVLRADVAVAGFRGESIVAAITDETGKELERQEAKANRDDKPLSFRFQFRPDRKGINFYRVRAFAATDEKNDEGTSREQTRANNSRLVVVDQGVGPYRVLYVTGRPNWEFKFLRRALAEDEQVELVGLIRIVRRQPKFDFQGAGSQRMSPLFDGFDHPDADTAERSDQPVLIRLGTLDEVELRDGFPKAADELYRYHAIILDDLEAGFFTPDQLAFLRNFVSQRGGGLLMLGGPDSFTDGKYDRTPVGELLPVYLNRAADGPAAVDQEHRLVLTREGWLQPWVRTRKTEDEERQRMASMAPFQTLNRVGSIKPGAVVLARVLEPDDSTAPALVAQQFGKGRVAALLIGDLWRWGLRRADPAENDLDRSWRQTVRWLVADVPERLEITARPQDNAPALTLAVRVRDAEYRPLDNAKVALRITLPAGDALTLDAEPDGREAGTYSETYVPKQPGAYRVTATATAPDGSAIGAKETGWAAQPAADEFARLEPDRDFLKTIAAKTNGEVVDGGRLSSFVSSLSARHAPITEPWTSPLWHHPFYFLIAIACLTAEWGLRRVNGLA